MSNLCTRVAVPDASVRTNDNKCRENGGVCYGQHDGGSYVYTKAGLQIGTSEYLWVPLNGSFDADALGIQCQAFSNAAISVVSLQSSMTNMQAQMTALISGSEVRAPNPEVIEAQAIVFGAVLTAGVLIWGMKRIYNLFMHPVDRGEKE